MEVDFFGVTPICLGDFLSQIFAGASLPVGVLVEDNK